MTGVLTRICLFPLKTARGTWQQAADVEPWGLRDDRRWGVLGGDGVRLKGVAEPRLMAVTATAVPGGLLLEAPGMPALTVPEPAGEPEPAAGFVGPVRTLPAPPEASAWLGAFLGREVTMIWQPRPAERPVLPEHGGAPGDVVSLADLTALLVTSESSLAALDDWVRQDALERGDPFPPEPLDMLRFRPNLVVGGFPPFAEDGWDRFRVGEVEFRVTAPCDRCAVTLFDPDTLARGREPIRTLSRHRKWGGLTWFGVRATPVPGSTGTIRAGEAVHPI